MYRVFLKTDYHRGNWFAKGLEIEIFGYSNYPGAEYFFFLWYLHNLLCGISYT
jgi:hypothetical protein